MGYRMHQSHTTLGRRVAIWALRGIVVLLGAWAAFRLLGLERGYPLVAVVAVTPHVAATAVLVLAIALHARRWPESIAAGIAVVLLAVAVLPRAVPRQPTGPIVGGVELDVLTVNLGLGGADATAVAELVRAEGVDLFSTQELTHAAARRLREAGLDRLLPRQHLDPTPEGSSGAGLYTRHPMRPLPSVPGGISRMLHARVEVNGAGPVEVVAVHPFPPTERNASQWRAGLEALPRADAGAGGTMRVLAGDFNATFDHAEFRDLVASGYVDAAAARGLGLEPTWPVGRVWAPPVTIDHVLVDDRVHVAGVEVIEVPGTDHRAVLAELVLPPQPRLGKVAEGISPRCDPPGG
jgi:endonuclease/exonuclease/phosphatase (EEP) superfamily protein YafD